VLIWYANIPEETEWFYTRLKGSWEPLSYALIFFHWLFPFLGLLSRHIRRRPQLVFAWAIYLLVVHFVEIYWIVMPQSSLTFGGAGGVITSLLMGLGMVGLYLGGLLWFTSCKQVKVLAVRDPRLSESLAFENI
jgi:apolipoprotein N-acyltransferase